MREPRQALPVRAAGLLADAVLLRSARSVFYDPSLSPFISRDLAVATRTVRGGTAIGIYPVNRYSRFELSGGLVQIDESYNDPSLQDLADQYQQAQFVRFILRNGSLVPLSAAFVNETTVFREFDRWRAARCDWCDVAPKIGNSLASDLRRRHPLLPASRNEWCPGAAPARLQEHRRRPTSYFGGNSEMRGYDYLSFVGQNVVLPTPNCVSR